MHISEIERIIKSQVRISKHEQIVDFDKFKDGHLNFLKGNPKNKTYMPYYDRLKKVACM